MSSRYDAYVGDTGTKIQIQVLDQQGNVTDVSAATSINFVFQKPTGVKITGTGGTLNGNLVYTTTNTDFDVAGNWLMQARYSLASPSGRWATDQITLRIGDVLGG